MSKKLVRIVTAAALGAAVLTAAAVLQFGAGNAAAQGGGRGPGGGGGGTCTPLPKVTPDPAVPLSAADAAGLQFMRQEEKLAHDVYVKLGEQYNVRIFGNIARSESRHMAALKLLLGVYSVPDPVAGYGPGDFADPEFTRQYEELTGEGARSLAAALQVGVVIEQKDIADLEARIAATDRADLKTVYGNLLRGSRNHLRAFDRVLDRL